LFVFSAAVDHAILARMSFIARLEAKLGRHAVPGLVTYLIAIQVAVYVMSFLGLDQQLVGQSILDLVWLRPERVRAGEAWRVVTFLFQPPLTNPIFAFFYWYLLNFFANTLEQHWGAFRLNLYLLVGWAATVLVALAVPNIPWPMITNAYLYTSLFLAFAHLYPEFELRLYFFLPVKVKWLALVTWIFLGYSVWHGGWPAFWIAAATVADFLLFLGGSVWQQLRHWWRGRRFQHGVQSGRAAAARSFHECRVCGLTSNMSPRTQFRYCSQCEGECCYCPEHIHEHEHVGSARSERSAV
jgi:hypothetical protein